MPDVAAGPANPSPYQRIAKSWKVAFRSELARSSMVDLPVEREGAADTTWRSNDRDTYIAAPGALKSAGAVRPKHALRFARAMFEAGLLTEAMEILLESALGSADPFEWAWLMALTHARLENFASAEISLGTCAALAAQDDQLRRVAALGRALQTQKGVVWETSWTQAGERAFELLELRVPELGCAVAAAFLDQEPRAALAEIDPILDCCLALLRFAKPASGRRLLGAMTVLYDALGEGEALSGALAAIDNPSVDIASPPATDIPNVQALHNCLAAACAANGRWRAATRRYVLNVETFRRAPQIMCELSRCVGRDVACQAGLEFGRSAGRPRIIDVFPFNGEFDMLALKLAAMSGWVDRFVIVEAAATFTGLPKPLSFPGRASEFAHLANKIVYVPVEEFPPHLTSAWAREFYQRDQAVTGLLADCSPEDVVIISDVDEIAARQAVEAFKGPLAGADVQTFLYFLNYEQLLPRPNVKTTFARARLLQSHGCSYLRVAARQLLKGTFVADAGWHFSNIGSPEALEWKFRSFSHQEWAHLDEQHFQDLIDQARTTGLGSKFRRQDLDGMPEFIRERRSELARWLL